MDSELLPIYALPRHVTGSLKIGAESIPLVIYRRFIYMTFSAKDRLSHMPSRTQEQLIF